MTAPATFRSLTSSINSLHRELVAQASRAVNTSLTLRNWLIGCHIGEFELHGTDRVSYGENLLGELAVELKSLGISNYSRRQLYLCLIFCRAYLRIVRTVSAQFNKLLPSGKTTILLQKEEIIHFLKKQLQENL